MHSFKPIKPVSKPVVTTRQQPGPHQSPGPAVTRAKCLFKIPSVVIGSHMHMALIGRTCCVSGNQKENHVQQLQAAGTHRIAARWVPEPEMHGKPSP